MINKRKNKEKVKKIIPANKDIINLVMDNFKGNFSLWFYKFTELTKTEKDKYYKPDSNAASSYLKKYDEIKDTKSVKKILNDFHKNQIKFCEYFQKNYKKLVIRAKVVTKLITGVGYPHPNEVGFALDYISGIPYIPATSIKGVLRFVFENEIANDNDNKNNLFGSGENKGNIIFLDVYPKDIPELCEDIINPHYGEYYSGEKPPADYLQPVPIKFLVVAEGTEFIFRFLIKRGLLKEDFKKIVKNALTEYGIGAKTSLGYGLFEIISESEPEEFLKEIYKHKQNKDMSKKKDDELSNMSKIEKICYKLENETNEEYGFNIYNQYIEKGNLPLEDKIKIAKSLKKFWQKINKWEGKQSKKQRQKIEKVKKILQQSSLKNE